MGRIPEWTKRMAPFARMYEQMCSQLHEELCKKSNPELWRIIDDTMQVTEMNCSWSTYRVARETRHAARFILDCRVKEPDSPRERMTGDA